MLCKKIIFLIGFLVVAANAQAATTAEIQALIQSLQNQILALQQQLTPTQATVAWCHNFNINLKIGDAGSEITALQTALQKEGLSASITNQFDAKTLSVVYDFQMKYKSEILTPSGLKNGTGFVGNATRAKLNKLYGCIVAPVPTPTPTTSIDPVVPVTPVSPIIVVGSLSLSLATDTPSSAVWVVGGENLSDIIFTKINFTASTSEDIYVKSIIIKRSDGRDVDFSLLRLWDGPTQIGDAQFLVDGVATFNFYAGSYWRIPKGVSKTLTIKANLRGIVSQYAIGSVTGDNPKLGIRADGVMIQGVTSGKVDLLVSGLSADLYGKEIILRKSSPTITVGSLSSNYLSIGTRTLYRWTISADSGGDIGWKKIKFEVTGTLNGIVANSSRISNLKVLDVKTGDEVTGNVTYTNTSNGFTINFVANNEQILSAGQFRAYQIGADILSVKSGDSILTKINSEATSLITTAYASVATGSFIWTDRSATGHSEDTPDWINDYKVSGLPTTALSLDRGGEPAPAITVIYPNGGEQLEVGKSYQIKWSSAHLPSGAKISSIQLSYRNTGGTYNIEDTIVNYTDNAVGYYDWIIPQKYGVGVQQNMFLIKITYTAADGTTVDDYSNEYFNITPASITQVGHLSVSLAADTPLPQDIVIGSNNVTFLKANFSANNAYDIQITSLKVHVYKNRVTTLDASTDIARIALYDGDTQISSYEAISNNVATFSGLVWIIPKDTTKILTVKADIPTTCTATALGLEIIGGSEISALGINPAPIVIIGNDGSAAGKTMTVISLSTGEIENQLADVSRAVLRLIEEIAKMLGR